MRALCEGVHASGVAPAHADAQRLTMELVGVLVRGWQVDDPPAALDAAGTALVRDGPAIEWLRKTLAGAQPAARFAAGGV